MIKKLSSADKTKLLVVSAFFVALDIIVARYLGFEFPSVIGPLKFDFQIVVAALCGYALGPLWGCLTLVTSDILGALLNSGTMGFFFGFTISAAIRGLLFGLLFHKKDVKPIRIILSIIAVFLPVDLCLNTLWLCMLMHASYLPLLLSRIAPKLILMTVEIVLTLGVGKLFNTRFSIVAKNN